MLHLLHLGACTSAMSQKSSRCRRSSVFCCETRFFHFWAAWRTLCNNASAVVQQDTCGAVWASKNRPVQRGMHPSKGVRRGARRSSGMSFFGGRAGILGRGGGAEDIDSGSPQIRVHSILGYRARRSFQAG